MKLNSLGYQTDLFFVSFDGEIIDRGEYLVLKTPTNPSFCWGNYLLFKQAPAVGDYQKWLRLFAVEIGNSPKIIHQVFGWDSVVIEPGFISPFLENGFCLRQLSVLAADTLCSTITTFMDLCVRPLISDEDFMQSVENQLACREEEFNEDAYRNFILLQMKRYQAMCQLGLGCWFGAFIKDRLVADLGIFRINKLGRYQSVQTHPNYRKQGIAKRLVLESGRYFMNNFGVERLLIVAEAGSFVEHLYKKVGFCCVEYQNGLEKIEVK